jgi:aspartate kinase
MSGGLVVIKIGGSVLTGPHAYRRTADFIAGRLTADPGIRIVAVVSAENGVTDALLATAVDIAGTPDAATLDLLWSSGELRSVALLTLALQARGVSAAAVNVHQAGLVSTREDVPGHAEVRRLRILALLGERDVIVAPGFLARGAGDAVVSLGRGGSDLTAVLLAAGLEAGRCELVKDVPGYFTADPKRDPAARPLATLSYERALEMADAGCQLVQRQALQSARELRVPLLISAIAHERGTIINTERGR